MGAVCVAVLVESLTVPAWVEWTIAQIDGMDACELVAVVVAPASLPSEAVGRAYRLYERADARVFGSAPALRAADLGPVAAGRPAVAGDGPLDVVVSFLPADRTAWEGPPPRRGVWAIVPMDDGRAGSAPARFRELRSGGPAAVTLVALAGDRTTVVARAATPADHLSLARTRDAAAWESAQLVLRSLRLVGRAGAAPAEPADPVAAEASPRAAVTVAHMAHTAVRGATARARSAWWQDEWFVAVRERSADGRVVGPLHALPNPPGRYLADPFPIAVGGRHHLFVEDYSRAAGRAVISVCEAGGDGAWSPPRTVLERDHHLSYPFVFEHDGEVYMLPETGEAGRVELHRAVAFPDRWELDRVLLEGLTALDATLHVGDDGLLWLFTHVVAGHGDRGELHLHSAPSLHGPWRPHPANPVVSDPGTARPAGRLYRHGGVLVRPGQDCSRRYGGAVVLCRVDALTPEAYRETPIGRIEPDWTGGLAGTHTFTFDSRYECLDGLRRVRRYRVRG